MYKKIIFSTKRQSRTIIRYSGPSIFCMSKCVFRGVRLVMTGPIFLKRTSFQTTIMLILIQSEYTTCKEKKSFKIFSACLLMSGKCSENALLKVWSLEIEIKLSKIVFAFKKKTDFMISIFVEIFVKCWGFIFKMFYL